MSAPTSHFFTVDVEEHFHVSSFAGIVTRADWDAQESRIERNVQVLLDLLARHETRGTFFTVGWVARKFPALVRRIAEEGHEVASHSYWHRLAYRLTPDEFRADVRECKAVLEDVTGRMVHGFRAPSFSIRPDTAWMYDILVEEGHRYDSSSFPIYRPDYGDPHAPTTAHRLDRSAGTLLELPLAVTNIGRFRIPAAGGGYLRHFPFAIIRRAFREHTARHEPGMFYVHPWEIDPGQPRVAVPMLTRVRHYRNLSRTLPRLERLLNEFRFTSVAAYYGLDQPTKSPAWHALMSG